MTTENQLQRAERAEYALKLWQEKGKGQCECTTDEACAFARERDAALARVQELEAALQAIACGVVEDRMIENLGDAKEIAQAAIAKPEEKLFNQFIQKAHGLTACQVSEHQADLLKAIEESIDLICEGTSTAKAEAIAILSDAIAKAEGETK